MFEKDKNLLPFTTFRIPAKARLFAEYSSVDQLRKITYSDEYQSSNVLHIGGGSNLLFVSDFDGLVLHSAIRGIKMYKKNEQEVFVIAGAGEKWTDLVDWCIDAGLAGMENMAGIPGEVGAAPVQNVGAYGAEAKDVIHSVECFDTFTREVVKFTNKECGFAYRDSNFKHEWKGRYFVLRVSFRLHPSEFAENFSYEGLRKFRDSLDHKPTLREVAEEVIRQRDSKLPNPSVIGSAGSFFKNPIVHRYYYEQAMLGLNPDIPCYPTDKEDMVKVPAGWLIDKGGMKGVCSGGAEVYPKNCLVIANKGDATAQDVIRLSREIIDKVRAEFGVVLEPEVNFIDTDIHVTILGSGTSKGIPEVGCRCKVCHSEDQHDKRLRASALVSTMGQDFLIDVSPDFRAQALAEDIYRIDAVLLTHSHYDHVGGIDDLRPFCAHRDVPIYLKEDVSNDLHKRLDYCFRKHPYPGVPTFELHLVEDKPFKINGVEIVPITVMHGRLPILGYRIGKFAYITDAKTIAEEQLEKLEGVSVLVINSLRFREHFSHLSVAEALEIIKRINPKEAYLTHFSHEAGFHKELEAMLPDNVHPCYDGLKIEIK